MSYRKLVHALVFDGFADHGIALALSELQASPRHDVIIAGFDRHMVTAASGLRVQPDIACEDIDLLRAGLFILPDGGLWQLGERLDVTDMLHSFNDAGVPVAAIGNATLAFGHAGLLDDTSHTGDDRWQFERFLRHYRGGAFYVDTPAISDENVITAGGTAGVDFAFEIIKQLELYEETDQPLWLERYKHGRSLGPLVQRRAA